MHYLFIHYNCHYGLIFKSNIITPPKCSVMCMTWRFSGENMTLEECRLDFEQSSNRAMSMPIAGAVVWALVAILSTQYSLSIR